MRIKHKAKRNRYFTIMIVPDAKHKPKAFRIPKWLLVPTTGSIIAVCILFSNMAAHIRRLNDELVYNDTIILDYSDQLNDNTNVVTKLKEEVNSYSKELQSIMTAVYSLEEKTSCIADDNNQTILKIGHLLGMEPDNVENIDDELPLTSRSGNRPKLKTVDTPFEQNYIRAVDEVIVAEKRISAVELSTAQLTEKVLEMEEYLLAYPSILPVEGRITSTMGERHNPFGKKTREFHSGVDIAVNSGTDVKATGKGKVAFAGYNGGYGNLVIIDHGFDMKTYYGHNSKLLVKEGDIVKRGDIIAKSGSTGRSTGPHVHYEIRIKNTPKDPLKFVLDFDKEDE